MPASIYLLILAGGSGERFWPLSRRTRPKQLLALFSKATLLEQTLQRVEALVPRERVLILTNHEQVAAVRQLMPGLPAENIVAEPAKRDTAAAIALGAAWVALRDPEAVMIVLPADHLIEDEAAFQNTLRTAVRAAEQSGTLVTIGIRPTWACPGFGYIELGERVALDGAGEDEPAVHRVQRFREKPSPEKAQQFFASGNFRWNAGMFIWTIRSITDALAQHAPELAEFIAAARASGDLEQTMAERFPTLPKISVDFAIMEKVAQVLVVEAAFDWDDVGSWTAAAKYLPPRGDENVSNLPVQALRAERNVVFTDGTPRHVALLGVSDLIVIQTADALLVCHRDEAEKIKEIVSQAPAELQ